MTKGDGLTTFGLAMGVFSVIPAIIASSFVLFREGKKLFGSLAAIAAVITIGALFA